MPRAICCRVSGEGRAASGGRQAASGEQFAPCLAHVGGLLAQTRQRVLRRAQPRRCGRAQPRTLRLGPDEPRGDSALLGSGLADGKAISAQPRCPAPPHSLL